MKLGPAIRLMAQRLEGKDAKVEQVRAVPLSSISSLPVVGLGAQTLGVLMQPMIVLLLTEDEAECIAETCSMLAVKARSPRLSAVAVKVARAMVTAVEIAGDPNALASPKASDTK